MSDGRTLLRDYIPIRIGEKRYGRLWVHKDITDRKHAEEALRESETSYRTLFESINESFCIIEKVETAPGEPIDFRYLTANPAFSRQAGVYNVLGKTIRQVVPGEPQEWFDTYDKVLRTGEPTKFELGLVTQGRILELYASRVEDRTHRRVAVLFLDITARKNAEEALKRSEAKYRGLFENTHEGVSLRRLIHNEHGDIVDAVMVDANRAALRIFGATSLEELREKKDGGNISPEINALAMNIIKRSMATEGSVTEQVHFDADDLYYTVTVAPLWTDHVIVTSVDITEQVKARKRIEELATRAESEKNRLRTILETMPVAVSIFDASCKLIEHNALAEKYSLLNNLSICNRGVGRKKTMRWWADTGMPVERDDLPLIKAITKGTTALGNIFDVELYEGQRATIMASAAPMRDEHRKIVGGVLVQQDVTEQRELEHDAIEAKERAELYVDLLTHDINNLNAGIAGYLQLVSERGDLKVKEKTYVQRSMDLLESSSHLIENSQEDTADRVRQRRVRHHGPGMDARGRRR